MTAAAKISCAQCNSPDAQVMVGTLWCWRHAAAPPRIGRYYDDAGQILWRAENCVGELEQAFCVLLDDREMFVRAVEETIAEGTAQLRMELTAPGQSDRVEPILAAVPLAAIVEAVMNQAEVVSAKRVD